MLSDCRSQMLVFHISYNLQFVIADIYFFLNLFIGIVIPVFMSFPVDSLSSSR